MRRLCRSWIGAPILISGMKEGDETDGYGDFPWTPIALSSLEPKLRKNIEEYMGSTGFF